MPEDFTRRLKILKVPAEALFECVKLTGHIEGTQPLSFIIFPHVPADARVVSVRQAQEGGFDFCIFSMEFDVIAPEDMLPVLEGPAQRVIMDLTEKQRAAVNQLKEGLQEQKEVEHGSVVG